MRKLFHLNVTMYVTGSVACYKTLSLIRMLKDRHANVRVVMSNAAQKFIGPVTFQAISGKSVITEGFVPQSSHEIPHVDLARWTDLAIVMPATANVIAKLVNGIADGIVSTCLLATSAPKIIVPAMNDRMWLNPATQNNVKRLDRLPGMLRLGPVNGKLAEEGASGAGRMVEPQQVINKLVKLSHRSKNLSGVRILVTAGGTREPIDPVRFITNASSGRMGYAIASCAAQLGAKVTLISGHTEVPVPKGVNLIKVKTTEDMEQAVLKAFPHNQALIMSAALADFTPVTPYNEKIKKATGSSHLITVKFKRTPDVLKQVAKIKRSDQITVGFAAETQNLINNAQKKLRAKKLDLIVANDVANSKIGFESSDNQVTFITSNGREKRTPVESKRLIASRLLDIVAKLKEDRS